MIDDRSITGKWQQLGARPNKKAPTGARQKSTLVMTIEMERPGIEGDAR